MTKSIIPGVLAIALLTAWPQAQQPAQPPAPQQPSEVAVPITTEGGEAPRLAVPDFIALSTDAETVATAKTISQVLWDDLNFEREFAFIPRDVYNSVPKTTSFSDIPFESLARGERRWPDRRHRAEDERRLPGGDEAVQRAGADGGLSPAIRRIERRDCSPTPSRTRSTNRSAR